MVEVMDKIEDMVGFGLKNETFEFGYCKWLKNLKISCTLDHEKMPPRGGAFPFPLKGWSFQIEGI